MPELRTEVIGSAEWLQIYREYDLAGVTRHVESLIAPDG